MGQPNRGDWARPLTEREQEVLEHVAAGHSAKQLAEAGGGDGPMEPGATMPDGGRPARILLVEDDAIVGMTIADMLRDGGFTVLEATDAAAALSFVEAGSHIDLVITDLHMRDRMNGLQLAQKIRLRESSLPIIIITADPEFPGLENFGPVIEKPFGTQEVLGIVTRTLGVEPTWLRTA